jgi:serine/threonine-protein kinase
MPEISAFDRALLTPSRPPRPAASLADLECCRNHPGHEGLAPAIEPDLPDGEVIDGRFVIREPVGRSDMATVYRAEDRSDGGRSVAIKIPLLKTESDPVLYGRFHREELIGVTLSHPNLLRFIKVSGEKSRPYIAMEYLDGCTLAYILHLARPLPERDSLRITAVACEALEYLHGRGYIHRDLKPSNIMICRDCTLRLMDYGLAEELKTRRSILDSMTPLFGTPEYMAPEQVRNARNTESTDIYSLGVVLYQMMTGVLPFPAQDPWVSAQMRVTGDPRAPREVNAGISAQAEEIVLHAMRRKPSERYPTMAAFHSELDAPERVHVTGLSGRLKAPSFRLSLEGTPILAGILIGLGVLVAAAAIVYLTIHGSGAHHAVRASGG